MITNVYKNNVYGASLLSSKPEIDTISYEAKNTLSNFVCISEDNTVCINEDNTEIKCDNGERLSLNEYVKKLLNSNDAKIEENKNNMTSDNKLLDKFDMLI